MSHVKVVNLSDPVVLDKNKSYVATRDQQTVK